MKSTKTGLGFRPLFFTLQRKGYKRATRPISIHPLIHFFDPIFLTSAFVMSRIKSEKWGQKDEK
jgi:hypothetical protein